MSVPAPACPLKTAGPLCVPVNVTTRQGAARAVDTLAAAATVKTNANTTNSVLVMIILPTAQKAREQRDRRDTRYLGDWAWQIQDSQFEAKHSNPGQAPNGIRR
jgi:hypothetical protein